MNAIYDEMRLALFQHFHVIELKELALKFIDYKSEEGFPFGNLTLLHYRMFGGRSDEIHKVAAAVELMILSLDILDDLQDDDNADAPWSKTKSSLSLNIATGFLLLSSQLLRETTFASKNIAIDELNKHVIQAVNGQHTDLLNAISTEAEYMAMVKLKSASLVASSCVVGATMITKEHLSLVKEYAEHIGIAAQIKNDLNDLLRLDGKNDLVNKKMTLPTILLLQKKQPELDKIRDYYAGKIDKEVLLNDTTGIKKGIEQSGVVQYCKVMIRIHQLEAEKIVRSMSVSENWKQKLLNHM